MSDEADTSIKARASEARRKVADASQRGREGAAKVKDTVMPVLDSVVEALGGWDELDKTIRDYNPTLAKFAKDSFFAQYSPVHGPAKFLMLMLVMGLVQSILPIFAWPLDFLARLLGFLLLYNTGLQLLQAGFESSSSPPRLKNLLSTFIISSLLSLIPSFLFDASHHFGALWCFFLPALLLVTPKRGGATVAVMICDTLFAQIGDVITSVVPASFQGKEGRTSMMIAGAVVAALFWVGYLGALGSYMAVWTVLTFHTIHAISKPIEDKADASAYKEQQTVWHNLLAIWLWRYLFTAVEGVSVPGLMSVIGLITFYLPSYFLWLTVFFFGMLMTKKVSESRKAATWYAKWLMGGFAKKAGSSSASRPSANSSSTSRPSGDRSSSSRSGGGRSSRSAPRS